ncbi:MAG: glycosyltransferase family 39 protein [Planctomycetes bacterium]|nr:glycosyltransferase family 39 protein [Planctomycetota bacterium]
MAELAPLIQRRDAVLHGRTTGALPLTASGRRLLTVGVPCLVGLAILALATWVRFADLGAPSLTHAEAWRANWSHHGTWGQVRRLPPLQYGLLAGLQRYVGRSELLLRAPSAAAGVLTCVALFALLRRRGGMRAALLAAGIAASHPVLIEQSRTLKVFSIEALVTVAVFWTGMVLHERRTIRAAVAFTLAALAGLAIAFTGSLTNAAWMAVLAGSRWRGGDATRVAALDGAPSHDAAARSGSGGRHAAGALGGRGFVVMATVLAVGGASWFFWLHGAACRTELTDYYFSSVEPVWPTSYAPRELAAWSGAALYGAGKYVLGMSHLSAPLSWVFGTLMVLACAAGAGAAWRDMRPAVAAGVILVLLGLAAGAARLYPFGELRTATYLVPLVAALAGLGLSEVIGRLGRSPATVLLLGMCVLFPVVQAARGALAAPATVEHVRPVFDHVAARLEPADALFVYYPVDEAFEFYWRRSEVPALVQPRSDRGDRVAFARRFETWMAQHSRVWFVAAHPWGGELDEWIAHLEGRYQVRDVFAIGDASARLVTYIEQP